MIWSYFDLAWHNLQTISEWFGVKIEVAEFGAHETRHEVLCCFCIASSLDICCCVPGAESPAWSSVSPMSRSAPPLSVPRHLQQREISAESALTAALQPATGALKLQWVLQHESCSRNCTQQVAPSPPIGSGHAWSPSLGEPSAPYKHIRWPEERKVEKTNRDIVVCEADLYILRDDSKIT